MDDTRQKPLKEAMEMELKELIAVQGPVEAEVIKSLLSSHNIPCIMRGQVVQSVHAFSADGLGKIKILVSAHDLPDAQKLIEQQPGE
jgi:hypothetical protein